MYGDRAKRYLERVRSGHSLVCNEPSLTKQSFKSECDINVIYKRWCNNGIIPSTNSSYGFFGDVSGISDFQSSLDQVNRVNSAFMELPAEVRSRFNNNPANLIDFASNPDNKQAMIDMGLLDKPIVSSSSTSTDVKSEE